MIEDLFCPRCRRLLRRNLSGVFCPFCGYSSASSDVQPRETDLCQLLRHIITRGMIEERNRIRREYTRGVVVDVSDGVATIECETFPKFDEGDVLGYIQGDTIHTLGVVMLSGKELIVRLEKSVKEGQTLYLCGAEILIGYERQEKILSEVCELKNEKYDCVRRFVFEHADFPEIRRIRVEKVGLDDSQREVVESILALEDCELLLVIGPPGTGKTTVIAEAIKDLYRSERILVTSHTNRAVDNVLEKLGDEYLDVAVRVGRPEKVHEKIHRFMLSYKAKKALGEWLENVNRRIRELKDTLRIIGSHYRDFKVLPGMKEKIRKYKSELKRLYEMRNERLREESEKILRSARIVGTTLIKSQLYPVDELDFDTVFIDECSQASIPLALLGIVKGKKWVLIGDPYQLLPIFKTIKDQKMTESLSAFCHLLGKYESRSLWLKTHYRSNDKIISFSARHIYGGKIRPSETCKSKALEIDLPGFLGKDKPVIFLNVRGSEEYDGRSLYNRLEAEIATEIASVLFSRGVRDIGVITPYKKQRTAILEMLSSKIGNPSGIEVGTVDAFQGREKSVIIYSVTATRPRSVNFAGDRNRFNVAVTRAIHKLIVLGNRDAMFENSLLSSFIDYARSVNGFYNVEVRSGERVGVYPRLIKVGERARLTLKNGETLDATIVEKSDRFLIVESGETVCFVGFEFLSNIEML